MTPKQDEIEALARVMFEAQEGGVVKYPLPGLVIGEDQAGKYFPLAAAILAAGYSRTDEAIERAAKVADTGHLVPPDGGSPSEAEHAVAKHIAAAIRAGKRDEP